MVYSIIQKSQLEGANRLDAEYYQLEYLELVKSLLSTKSYEQWADIKGRFITGPFGSEFNVENYVNDTNYRYIRGKDVREFFLLDNDNVYIPEKDFQRLKKYSLQEEDILVSVVGTLGNTSIIDKFSVPAIFSCKSTVFRTESINPYYFIAYLNSSYGRNLLTRSVRGHVQTGLNIYDLKSLLIFVPSEENQKLVASFVIQAKQNLKNSELLYSQAKDLLLEELGLKDFVIEDDLTFVVNFSDVKSVNRIDADYFQPKYSNLINRLGKNAKPLKSLAVRKTKIVKIENEKEYKYIEIGDVDVGNGGVVSNPIVGRDLPLNAKVEINGGELIISKVRPTRGAIAIIPSVWNGNFIASSAFTVFEVNSVLKEYLQVVLKSIIGGLQLEKPTTGTSYPTITDEDVENVLIPILPKPTQQKIADLVRQSHEARKKSKELLEEAKRRVEEMIETGGES